jgi:hypothetical protein
MSWFSSRITPFSGKDNRRQVDRLVIVTPRLENIHLEEYPIPRTRIQANFQKQISKKPPLLILPSEFQLSIVEGIIHILKHIKKRLRATSDPLNAALIHCMISHPVTRSGAVKRRATIIH